jgi:hypothetical protein
MWMPGRQAARPFSSTFAQALDKLADPRPPMRVGAVHTLEALGQDDPQRRQAIVDVLCAYLRMPAGDDGPVRGTVQRVLATHLRPGGPAFWSGLTLDLTGATLSDFDLSGCRVDGSLGLDRAVFVGPARFRATVTGSISLHGATFGDHAWFERSVFRGASRFDTATFRADAWFGEATFAGPATFSAATFGGHAWFAGCSFQGPVFFDDAVFRRSAGFRGAVAHATVGLTGTTFLGAARVSRRGEEWNIGAPGWRVVVDPDNEAVGQLLWVGHPELVSP